MIVSMRSSATFDQCFTRSGTSTTLWTRPATSSSMIHSRWFGETRNIVEHRHPNWSSVSTVRSGATSRASRLTRCTSVPMAHTEPGGLSRTVLRMNSVDPASSAACTTSHGVSGCTITLAVGCCFRTFSI